jgi:ABC-type transport system involved in cytochrome c biogenesis permease component
MIVRRFLSIFLNIIAVFVPAVVLFRMFGLEAKVDPQSLRDLLALLGTAFFSFVVGLASAALLRTTDKPFLITVLEDLMPKRSEPEEDPLPKVHHHRQRRKVA